jgi:hypothetical protein
MESRPARLAANELTQPAKVWQCCNKSLHNSQAIEKAVEACLKAIILAI